MSSPLKRAPDDVSMCRNCSKPPEDSFTCGLGLHRCCGGLWRWCCCSSSGRTSSGTPTGPRWGRSWTGWTAGTPPTLLHSLCSRFCAVIPPPVHPTLHFVSRNRMRMWRRSFLPAASESIVQGCNEDRSVLYMHGKCRAAQCAAVCVLVAHGQQNWHGVCS
jgi:hypothetical protein